MEDEIKKTEMYCPVCGYILLSYLDVIFCQNPDCGTKRLNPNKKKVKKNRQNIEKKL